MSFKILAKQFLEKIPPSVGTKVNFIPFSLRLGNSYTQYLNDVYMNSDIFDVIGEEYINRKFETIIAHFSSKNKFYEQFLSNSNFDRFGDFMFEDIKKIPIINKSILKNVPVEVRSCKDFGLGIYNTGGTSGSPLSFYVEKNFYAREWAHMHFIWKRVGYHPSKTKVTIRGKKLNNLLIYNFNQNEFLVDSYHYFEKSDYIKLLNTFKKYNVEFIHGYPSAIYNFLKEAAVKAPFLVDFLRANIRGILFGSEFPAPHYRDFIENLITLNTVSWYGHTEGIILAAELYQKFEYVPFVSYGYAEAVKINNSYHLIGTCFDNLATPFIRYDTEDIICPNFGRDNILHSFEIKEGRIGEFIVDKMNHNISLTSLIFGRHHNLFNLVDFIQVKQPAPGSIIIFYSSFNIIDNPFIHFDSSNLRLDITFQKAEKPFKTSSGKIPLLIK